MFEHRTEIEARAHELLTELVGAPARFRDGQLEAVTGLVCEGRSILCVQRTGWGKSAVYFLATALLRARGAGPTLLISPLIALMRNQVAAAERVGIRARTMNVANRDEWDEIFEELAANSVDLLLVSPERLNNNRFQAEVLDDLVARCGLLVVDEAHCISDWGHDFRPDYRRIAALLTQLAPTTGVVCTTATANDRVIRDVLEQLNSRPADGEGRLTTIRGALDRRSLRLEVVDLPSAAERLGWLATHVPRLPGSGIVYCLTVRDAELVASWLRTQGIDCAAYTGQDDSAERLEVEDRLLRNDAKAVAATSALGMGYDKPDLGFVVHFQSPGSPIAYYQQVGRAGRQLKEAHAVLLCGAEDREIQDYFIKVAFPPREQAEQVLELLEAAEKPVTLSRLLGLVNVRRGRLEAMLKVLEVEGAVARNGSGWYRTGAPWVYDAERTERVTAVRRREQAAMETYAQAQTCLMHFLREQLDDPDTRPCGRCSVCTEARFADVAERPLVLSALEHIRRRPIVLEARRQWPAGSGLGRIPEELRLQPGRALSVYGDAGWGRLVREGKYGLGRFGEELVSASVELLYAWAPKPFPEWVTCVPSLRHPSLVPEFAERLANGLGLPFDGVVQKLRENPAQKEMENAAHQAQNVRHVFAAAKEHVRPFPVLLVDDICDSGLTLTTIGTALRKAGAGPVFPFVLARAAARA